jgi:hypothetical protein
LVEIKAREKFTRRHRPVIKEIVRLAIPWRATKSEGGANTADPAIKTPVPDAMPAKDILARIERIDVKLPEVPSLVFELNEIIAHGSAHRQHGYSHPDSLRSGRYGDGTDQANSTGSLAQSRI